ncbi:alpha/beta hydrolase [Aurantibacter crassamenti]|uniref:alpha/beta fold hydrolase n=1 Tax=Aurantibacter crassamenti TaxID=1837375 RepID=UPI00193A480E|nr:alpha/beta hydrolase [Aurantibacter crassamenti]MBM1105427.1 alpha/beta hydrolase [Aurantibacter crassamenti]
MTFPLHKTFGVLHEKNADSKYTIIYIHGNSVDSEIWQNQLNSSLFSEYRMLAIDLPGHGKSTKCDGYSVPNVVKILAATIQEYSNVVLVGHSLGGHFAIETLPFLNNCKGIFVFGTAPVKKPVNMHEAFLADERMPLLFQKNLNPNETEDFTRFICKKSDLVPYNFKERIHNTDAKFREDIGLSLANGELANEVEILAKTEMPVAILHGKNDSLVNLEYLKQLSIPNLWRNKINIIESSHSPHLEKPEEFNRLLLKFLENL